MKAFDNFLDYIDNAGGAVNTEWFDEDWEPIGPLVRRDMIAEGFAEQYQDGTARMIRRKQA